jgi:hypothetical protein
VTGWDTPIWETLSGQAHIGEELLVLGAPHHHLLGTESLGTSQSCRTWWTDLTLRTDITTLTALSHRARRTGWTALSRWSRASGYPGGPPFALRPLRAWFSLRTCWTIGRTRRSGWPRRTWRTNFPS